MSSQSESETMTVSSQTGHRSTGIDVNIDQDCHDAKQETMSSVSTDDSEMDDEDLEKSLSSLCVDYRCSYGPSLISKTGDPTLTDDLYECTHPECSDVCATCKSKGGHKSHLSIWFKVMTHEQYINFNDT